MTTLANIYVLADFKKHVHDIVDIYAAVTGNTIKGAILRTKINMSGDSILTRLKPHVLEYKPYIDSGDVVAFMKADHSKHAQHINIGKFLKIIKRVHESASADDMANIIALVRQVADTCMAYVDT